MDEIRIFSNDVFGEIRTAGTPDAPLFCLTDVCKALELQSSAVMRRLEKGVISSHPLDTAGGQQLANFVTEDGLYDVILDSRKPEAKVFRKWVTSEVLPSIRKTGGYIATTSTMTDTEIMAKAILLANNTIEQRNARIKELEDTNEKQTSTIARLQPKAEFADAAFKAEGKVDIGQAAKILGLPFGRNTLFKKLKEKGVFFGSRNEPKQRYIDAGYFELSQLPPIKRDHHPDLIVMKCTCTQKGLAYINHLFGGNPTQPSLTVIM